MLDITHILPSDSLLRLLSVWKHENPLLLHAPGTLSYFSHFPFRIQRNPDLQNEALLITEILTN